MRQFGTETYLAIKASCRDLVALAGGPLRVSKITRAHQGHVSTAISQHDMERFLCIDQIADLEAEVQEPVVTRLLAEMAGYDLEPRAVINASPRTVHQHLAQVITETADVTAAVVSAMADGKLDDGERTAISKEIEQAIIKLQALKADLRPALKAVQK